jgi:hypothetical protein
LREQQGLSPLATSEDSSSGGEEEEESDGGQARPERWEPAPPSPRAAEAAKGQVSGAGVEVLAARRSTEEVVRAMEAPARAAVAFGSAAATSRGVATAATGAAAASAEPSRKRKRGFPPRGR